MEKLNEYSTSVAVVVLSFNNFDDTSRCIRSVLAVDYPNYRIIIVDNNSSDGCGQLLKKEFPQLEVHLSAVNGGYAAGTNIGIRSAIAAGVAYILVLNPDTIVEPNILTVLTEVLENDCTAGISTCKTLYERTGKIYVSAGSVIGSLCAVAPLPLSKYETECSVSYVAGCVMLIRREVFEQLGLLDERYFMYYEDVEFSMRVSTRYAIRYTPKSVVIHKSGGGDAWSNYSPFYLYYSSRNRILVFGTGIFLKKMHAMFMNACNIVLKIAVLAVGLLKGKKNMFQSQTAALLRGFRDGMSGVTGRNSRYY